MTCERGLKDYMICTNCHTIFTEKAIEVGHLFNCRSDLAVVCSLKCKEQVISDSKDGSWMQKKNAKK